ncbi:MAG: hypothetical protein VX614_10505 [Myxococcota bacterium]|nr:hypothetical protein [Myxococcota bacterium]
MAFFCSARSPARLVTPGLVAVAAALAVILPVTVHAADGETDLSKLDLRGDWSVLIHSKSDRSENRSITKFKDLAWTIEQSPNTLTWEEYPYVMFGENTELVRRHAMVEHLPWEPEGSVLSKLRSHVDVSSRAMKRKRMKGNFEKGFRSLPPLMSGGLNMMTFTRTWTVTFEPEKVRVQVVDSLGSESGAIGEIEGATVFEITEKVDENEYRGRYSADSRRGTFRMLRSSERRVVK